MVEEEILSLYEIYFILTVFLSLLVMAWVRLFVRWLLQEKNIAPKVFPTRT